MLPVNRCVKRETAHTTKYSVCNNNDESIDSLSGEYYDEDLENGSSVDIDTEADDDGDCLFEAEFNQQHSWLATAAAANQDKWHYNERAYEELCYVTFNSEVITRTSSSGRQST